jgi:hypothetical protein
MRRSGFIGRTAARRNQLAFVFAARTPDSHLTMFDQGCFVVLNELALAGLGYVRMHALVLRLEVNPSVTVIRCIARTV